MEITLGKRKRSGYSDSNPEQCYRIYAGNNAPIMEIVPLIYG